MFHEYNEINDMTQFVLDMLALSKGGTIKEQFADFGLHIKFSAKWPILI